MSLVSIIIPVYNTEKYLQRCLESALSQSYTELQILLIDDGSTDSSGEICDSYAERDGRVTVYHLKNGGVSAARNFGIDKAEGDYIVFLDSDDHISSDAIESELRAVLDCGADMAVFSLIFDDGKKQTRPTLKEGVYSPIEYLSDGEQDVAYICSPCNKIYKASVLKDNGIRFTDGIKYGEDFIFNSKCLACINTLTVKNDSYYYYDVSREGSGVKRLYPNYDDFIVAIDTAFRDMLSRLGVSNEDMRLGFMAQRWDYAVNILLNSDESFNKKAEILSGWISVIPEADAKVFASMHYAISVFCSIPKSEVRSRLRKYLRKEKFRRFLVKIKRFLRRIK